MMRWLGVLPSTARFVALAGLLAACALGAAGCSGEGTAAPEAKLGDSPDLGRTLQAQGWVVTLIEQPEQRKQVGTGTERRALARAVSANKAQNRAQGSRMVSG